MTIQEILKAKGVSDDVIDGILSDMKSNKIYTASEENLDVRYGKLKGDHDNQSKQLEEANALIAELKKSNKGNESLQAKVSEYESTITQLEEQLKQTKIENAIKVGLLSEHALDVDYLTFKLKEKGEIELDENDHIKGWDDKIAGLKTQFPTQFEGKSDENIIENKLPKTDDGRSITKEQFGKMSYQDRLKIHNDDPELYAELTGKKE